MKENARGPSLVEGLKSQDVELAALRRMLDVSEGTFSLSIAICNSPSLREYLIEKLKKEKEGIKEVEIQKDITDVFEYVKERVPQDKNWAVFITGLEKNTSSDEKEFKIFRVLNTSRERWKSVYSCPIVFWLPEYAVAIFSRYARDFWSWISHLFEFISEELTVQQAKAEAYSGYISSAANLDVDQKNFRIAELEQRIQDVHKNPKKGLSQYLLLWMNELAFIYMQLGELDKAEGMHNKTLEIAERLGLHEGMASAYGNLGLIYQTRGELGKAEEMQKKSLEIAEKLGLQKIMTNQYCNLGLIYRTRGELDKAEEMLKKSLEIAEKLGLQKIMSDQYGNLGVIYQMRGELDKAEEMHREALEIAEKLGVQEIMANTYGNLGLIYQDRGELGKAEEMLKRALEISEKLGLQEIMANAYSNLGLIYQTRGELDKAEELHKKALEINEKLGHLEGTANQYVNLGSIYKERGDKKKAREYWEKARDLYKTVGIPHMEKILDKWIEGLDKH
jgi:tetratricopeptide (TPR) repeat protein